MLGFELSWETWAFARTHSDSGRSLIGREAGRGAQCSHETTMQPRAIATGLCFAATVFAGCALGLSKPGDGALRDRAWGAGTGAPAQQTARPQETLAMQPEKVGRLKAALHDFGRYYK